MKYRILKNKDGKFKAQLKGWFFWHNFTYSGVSNLFCYMNKKIKFSSTEATIYKTQEDAVKSVQSYIWCKNAIKENKMWKIVLEREY